MSGSIPRAVALALLLMAVPSAAWAKTLTYRHQYLLYSLDPARYPRWRTTEEVWLYQGKEIVPPSSLLVDGDTVAPLPEGFLRTVKPGWDREAIAETITKVIAARFERDPGAVRIFREADAIAFDGVGLPGRTIDLEQAVDLTIAALDHGIADIVLPVLEKEPSITVEDADLKSKGIKEVVTVGESDFSGSPVNRRHNIGVGLSKFKGTIIPQGATFSFNAILGPVDASTGYRKELVIQGQETLPDYGGGLCQISSTAYRGVWAYGFPILTRKNHSYAVHYYAPHGTDATIYPPRLDMKFLNDSPGALLIQTATDEDSHAYYIYYGTRDDRRADLVGPFTWGFRAPPPDRIGTTTDIPPGEKRKVGERVPGLTALWGRIVHKSGEEDIVEEVRSVYEARPLYYQIGVEARAGTGSTVGIEN